MIYDFNFGQNFTALLPARLRLPRWVAWMSVLAIPLQWARDMFFNSYVNGSTDPIYIGGFSYIKGRRVRYGTAIYEAINVPPIGANPTDANYWYKVQDSWVGLAERITYTSQKIRLEYALNRNFGVTVSLPFAGADHATQIYIPNSTAANNPFVIGGATPSVVYATEAYATNYVINSYNLNGLDFSVYVPSSYYSPTIALSMAQFIDKYVTAGILYTITPY